MKKEIRVQRPKKLTSEPAKREEGRSWVRDDIKGRE